jgi:hypothetical protein
MLNFNRHKNYLNNKLFRTAALTGYKFVIVQYKNLLKPPYKLGDGPVWPKYIF